MSPGGLFQGTLRELTELTVFERSPPGVGLKLSSAGLPGFIKFEFRRNRNHGGKRRWGLSRITSRVKFASGSSMLC